MKHVKKNFVICMLAVAGLGIAGLATSASAAKNATNSTVQPCDEGQKPPCVNGKSTAATAKIAAPAKAGRKANAAGFGKKGARCDGFSATGGPATFGGGSTNKEMDLCCGSGTAGWFCKNCRCGGVPKWGEPAQSLPGCACCENPRNTNQLD